MKMFYTSFLTVCLMTIFFKNSFSQCTTPVISGNATSCQSDGGFYFTQVGMTAYEWSVSAGGIIISPPGVYSSISIRWDVAGTQTLGVRFVDGSGCLTDWAYKTITVLAKPTPTVTGNNAACLNSSGNIYSTDAGQSSYLWVVNGGTIDSGQGTNSISVTWTSTSNNSVIAYYGTATCSSWPGIKNVTVSTAVTSIAGPSTACKDNFIVYTTEPGKSAYNWTITGGTFPYGQATNSVTVLWTTVGNNNISVSYSDPSGCIATPSASKTVAVVDPPSPTIAGTQVPCQYNTYEYTTEADMSNYVWTFSWPPGSPVSSAQIVSGDGTNKVTVAWGVSGPQTISVNYRNTGGCYALYPTSMPVTVAPVPYLTITGSGDVCQGAHTTYSATPGKSTYNWSLSSGGRIISGQGSQTITVVWDTPATSPDYKTVSVNYGVLSNGCQTPTSSYYLRVNPAPTIIASNALTICSGQTVSLPFYASNLPSTYTWSAADNPNVTGEILTQQTSMQISNTLINTTGIPQDVVYTVIATSSIGCAGIPFPITVTVQPLPLMTNPAVATICSNSQVNLALTTNIPVSLIQWSAYDNPNTTGEGYAQTAVINNYITNNTTVAQDVIYTARAWTAQCIGPPQTVTITVKPAPIMTSPGSGVGCNNVQLNHPLTSNLPATFQWYASNNPSTTGESLSVQSSSTINNTIFTNTQQVVSYTVIPTATNGCVGNSQTVSMLVNASPPATITAASATGICANGSVILNANFGSGLSYQWFKGGVSISGATSASYTASTAGSYTVQVTNLSTSCSATSAPTVVSLVKCSQTITFGPISSKTYSDVSFSLNATASSGLPVTYASSNSSVATVSGNTVTITGVGTTTITASQAGNVDFFAAPSVPQPLTVTKAMLVATASSPYKTYGAANPALTISYSGFVNGETAAVINTPPTVSTTATVTSNVGTYPVTAAGGSDNNYTFTYVNGTLTVYKAVLQVTADNKSRTYGSANPALTISYSGFLNGETATVVDTPPIGSTTADLTTSVGTYSIVPAGGTDNNYTFNYVNGTLTITKASLLATCNMSRQYNTPNPTFVITYTGLKNGETAYVIDVPPTASTSATLSSPVGSYPITLSGGSDNNYSIATSGGTLTVTKANQTVTFQAIPAKCAGGTAPLVAAASSGLTITFSSSNTSIATISGSTANALQTGTVTITATQAGNSNYNPATATQPLTVLASPARPSISQIGCVCEQYVTLQASGGTNYVWSTGYVGQTVNMVSSDIYYVISTNANGCSRQSLPFTVTIPSCPSDLCGPGMQSRISKSDLAEEDEFHVSEPSIYPNPADEKLTVHVPEPVNEKLTLSLYSQFGQEVKSAVVIKGENKIDFETKSLSKGMYILTLRTSSGNAIINRKVFIIH